MSSGPIRFPKNAPGPFYTTGLCLACGAPEDEAGDLLAALNDDNYETYFETYFVRQPATPEEVERACRAAEVCCVSSLRYGGNDPAIIRRLGNRSEFCDHVLPGGPVRLPWEKDDQWRAVKRRERRWWQFWRK